MVLEPQQCILTCYLLDKLIGIWLRLGCRHVFICLLGEIWVRWLLGLGTKPSYLQQLSFYVLDVAVPGRRPGLVELVVSEIGLVLMSSEEPSPSVLGCWEPSAFPSLLLKELGFVNHSVDKDLGKQSNEIANWSPIWGFNRRWGRITCWRLQRITCWKCQLVHLRRIMFDVEEILKPFITSHDSWYSWHPHLERSTKLDSKIEKEAHLHCLRELVGQFTANSFSQNRKTKQHWELAVAMPSCIQLNSSPLLIQNASQGIHVTHGHRWIYPSQDAFLKPVLKHHRLYTTPISELGKCRLRVSGELNRRRWNIKTYQELLNRMHPANCPFAQKDDLQHVMQRAPDGWVVNLCSSKPHRHIFPLENGECTSSSYGHWVRHVDLFGRCT